MNYEEFTAIIIDRIQQLLGPDVSIQLQTFCKNNGLKLDGLVISNSESNISPTIFLNYYYEQQNIFPDFDAICKDIVRTYMQNRSTEYLNADFFNDFEVMRSHTAYRLINYEKNKELLETVPYVRYLDLAIVFYCLLDFSKSSNATVLIHNSHLEIWNITVAQLYEQACQTTPALLPYDFRNMTSLMTDLWAASILPKQPAAKAADFCPMYILTNVKTLYGASCILYPGLLEAISEKLDADLYILPSSIHEIILLPVINRSYGQALSDMVAEINQTELAADEVLSSHIYHYSRAEQALHICF